MLVENADLQSVMENPGSIEKLDVSHQSFNDSRLTCTVRADQRDSSIKVHIEVDVGQDGFAAGVADLSILKSHARSRDLLEIVRELEINVGILQHFFSHADLHLGDGLHTRLG